MNLCFTCLSFLGCFDVCPRFRNGADSVILRPYSAADLVLDPLLHPAFQALEVWLIYVVDEAASHLSVGSRAVPAVRNLCRASCSLL